MKNIITNKNNQKYNNLKILVNFILSNNNSLTMNSHKNISGLHYNQKRPKYKKKKILLNNTSSSKEKNESLLEYKTRLKNQIGVIYKAYNIQDNHLSTIENNENNKLISNLKLRQKSCDDLIQSILPNKPKLFRNETCQTSNFEKKLKPIVSSLKLSNDKINVSYVKKRNKMLKYKKNKSCNALTSVPNEYKPLVNYNIYFEDVPYKIELPPIKVNRFLDRQIPDKRIETLEENQKRFDLYKFYKTREKLYKFK